MTTSVAQHDSGLDSGRPDSGAGPQLVQSLGLFSATTIVVGSMIGSGIFIVDCDIARLTDSPALYLAAWVVTAVMTMICALSYGELAAMMPKAGGQYVYLRESLGPLWGFLYGWTLFLVIETGTIAAVCVAFGKFLGVFFPTVSSTHWLWHIAHVPRHSRWSHGAWQYGDRHQHRESGGNRCCPSAGRREYLRHEVRRAGAERFHGGQGAVARGADSSGIHRGPQQRGHRGQLRRPLESSSGGTPAGAHCIPCRWARRGRP